jgi:hypothetical protein
MTLNSKNPSSIKQKEFLKWHTPRYIPVIFLCLKHKERISKAFRDEKTFFSYKRHKNKRHKMSSAILKAKWQENSALRNQRWPGVEFLEHNIKSDCGEKWRCHAGPGRNILSGAMCTRNVLRQTWVQDRVQERLAKLSELYLSVCEGWREGRQGG